MINAVNGFGNGYTPGTSPADWPEVVGNLVSEAVNNPGSPLNQAINVATLYEPTGGGIGGENHVTNAVFDICSPFTNNSGHGFHNAEGNAIFHGNVDLSWSGRNNFLNGGNNRDENNRPVKKPN